MIHILGLIPKPLQLPGYESELGLQSIHNVYTRSTLIRKSRTRTLMTFSGQSSREMGEDSMAERMAK